MASKAKAPKAIRVSDWAYKLVEAEIASEVKAGRKAPSQAGALDRLLQRLEA